MNFLLVELRQPGTERFRFLPVQRLGGVLATSAPGFTVLRGVLAHHLQVLPLRDGRDGEVEGPADFHFVRRPFVAAVSRFLIGATHEESAGGDACEGHPDGVFDEPVAAGAEGPAGGERPAAGSGEHDRGLRGGGLRVDRFAARRRQRANRHVHRTRGLQRDQLRAVRPILGGGADRHLSELFEQVRRGAGPLVRPGGEARLQEAGLRVGEAVRAEVFDPIGADRCRGRGIALEHLEPDHAECVNVVRRGGRFLLGLLGGSVEHGRGAAVSEPLEFAARPELRELQRPHRFDLPPAEVRDPHGELAAIGGMQDHIRGFQVAVNHALRVRLGHDSREPAHQFQRGLGLRVIVAPLPIEHQPREVVPVNERRLEARRIRFQVDGSQRQHARDRVQFERLLEQFRGVHHALAGFRIDCELQSRGGIVRAVGVFAAPNLRAFAQPAQFDERPTVEARRLVARLEARCPRREERQELVRLVEGHVFRRGVPFGIGGPAEHEPHRGRERPQVIRERFLGNGMRLR